ncbi:MAG: NAD(P)-dependent alcohol dehydrogenase [Actinomycetota bacterium]|jgi:NADPH:quinone reductase-like Zn-dependent oxidoreductase|nr:NAD(P)-dependent alcohol dehydrogenase [Actinomycetota bacterium]
MRAAVCSAYGPPDVLKLADVPDPTPKAGEVRVRIRATAVTSSDCYVRGLDLSPVYSVLARVALGWRAPRQPILGMVLSGEVDAVGSDVTRFAKGDAVFGFDRRRFGTYAQYVCWPQHALLASRPANLTNEEAAAIPYGGLLALHFLRRSGVASGQRILIYGASGAVGTSAVQLATAFGAHVTGVCSTSNVDLVRSLGAERVIDYTQEDFSADSARYHVFLDTVGKRKSANALRKAKLVLVQDGCCVSVDDGTPKLTQKDLELLAKLAVSGDLRPVIDRVYPLDQIVEAHQYVSGGHKKGNVIVTVG